MTLPDIEPRTTDRAGPDVDQEAIGLTGGEALGRLRAEGPNAIEVGGRRTLLVVLLAQVRSPLVVILIVASLISILAGEPVEASIILAIVVLSALLGFVQEARSEAAVEALRRRVALHATVIRDGREQDLPAREVVRGDLLTLVAGDIVPADARVVAANHLFLDESALTGESAPARKTPRPGDLRPEAEADRAGLLFFGTSVVGGTGRATVTATGARTAYGTIARRLAERAPETDFQRGIRAFGMLIARTTLLLVVGVLVVNVGLKRPVLESLLFAIALAVGLTPELLPAIVVINLSRGARGLSRHGVIVKRLPAIQNLGSMTVLCTDKTGTLTEGRLTLERAVAADGGAAEGALPLAFLNSHFQTGYENPLDAAVVAAVPPPSDLAAVRKLAELPFDFSRRCLSVAVQAADAVPLLITKGAPEAVLARSTTARVGADIRALDAPTRERIVELIETTAAEGYHSVAIGSRLLSGDTAGAAVGPEAGATSAAGVVLDERLETELVFEGLLLFSDPPKSGVGEILARLEAQGVELKIVTGDHELVARQVADRVGLPVAGTLTGEQIRQLPHSAFVARAQRTTIFARVDPDQKLRVLLALRERGAVVGYVGDGVNDGPPLHAADVSISVDNATDVARAAADIILLERSLEAISQGVAEGRRTFANTLKYIRMGASSNFGNMFSMAGATLFLPFLPMLPVQVLLNNLIYDVSQTAIPSDLVDADVAAEPARWDLHQIERFMLIFGPISSIFDYLTFFLLLVPLAADETTFHTGWFVESLATQVLVIFAIRTRQSPFWRSRPSRLLAGSALAAVATGAIVTVTPLGGPLGFVALPVIFWPLLIAMVATYLLLVEVVKRRVLGAPGSG